MTKEVQRALAMNMMYRGFISDPDHPGSEKVVLTTVNEKWIAEPRMRISCSDFEADASWLPPQVAFAAKGWNRSVSCWMVLCAAWELGSTLVKARRFFLFWLILGNTSALFQCALPQDHPFVKGHPRGSEAAEASTFTPGTSKTVPELSVKAFAGLICLSSPSC